jgi:hypothetical protein
MSCVAERAAEAAREAWSIDRSSGRAPVQAHQLRSAVDVTAAFCRLQFVPGRCRLTRERISRGGNPSSEAGRTRACRQQGQFNGHALRSICMHWGELVVRLLGVRARGCEDATTDRSGRARTPCMRTTLTGSSGKVVACSTQPPRTAGQSVIWNSYHCWIAIQNCIMRASCFFLSGGHIHGSCW